MDRSKSRVRAGKTLNKAIGEKQELDEHQLSTTPPEADRPKKHLHKRNGLAKKKAATIIKVIPKKK